MQIKYHKKFKKSLKKQPTRIQRAFFKKLELFGEDQFHYSLNNHALIGKFNGWRSINITGDFRVHYEEVGEVIILINIGSHSELY